MGGVAAGGEDGGEIQAGHRVQAALEGGGECSVILFGDHHGHGAAFECQGGDVDGIAAGVF